jgi:hypothetical protein
MGEVSHAAVGIGREQANHIVKELHNMLIELSRLFHWDHMSSRMKDHLAGSRNICFKLICHGLSGDFVIISN